MLLNQLCPICQQSSLSSFPETSVDYLSKEPFQLLFCDHCDCYMTQPLSPAKSTDYYGEAYYNSKQGKFSPLLEQLFRWNHRRNALALYRQFQPQKVLEIGCGRAYLLKEFKKLGCEVFCLESATAAAWILNNPEVQVIGLSPEQPWTFAPESFQLIILWHVFEHLPYPVTILAQITQVLEHQQVLCISVPNIASYQARLKLTTWFHLDVPRHLFHFSQHGLIALLEQHDYEIIKVTSGDRLQNLFGWFQSLANLLTPHATNGLYRFLQGGTPRRTAEKWPLFIQLSTAPLWIPLGIIGYLLEEITRNYGTITIYARKK